MATTPLKAERRRLVALLDAEGPAALLAEVARKCSTVSPEAAAEYRRAVTRDEPLLFALVYLRRHLRAADEGAPVTLSAMHRDWARRARAWRRPAKTPRERRHAVIAPRESGKSTWHFLLLPAWAAAHGHARFAAAFADTGTQAETHLATFKSELDNNALLRADFPDLCSPKTRGRGTTEADRVSLYHARSGFVFAAAGMDGSNLGLKVGARRPDLIILDDIEPHESRYSAPLAAKRLDTLLSAILPLNIYATVIAVGTVTMQGSIMHQLVAAARGEQPAEWVGDEGFQAHHYLPIVQGADGEPVSAWPEKWSLEWLQSIQHTRSYAKNYLNDPMGADGGYWTMDDFTRGTMPGVSRRVLSVDPAVTTSGSSDFTGLAVVGWEPPAPGSASRGRCYVEHASAAKLDPKTLRERVLTLIDRYDVGLVLVETNQGGDLWASVLWGLPVKIRSIRQTVKKEHRAAAVLNHYQRGRVVHAAGLTEAEQQMVAFPKAPHDDMVDAIGTGVAYFLERKPAKKRPAVASMGAYV